MFDPKVNPLWVQFRPAFFFHQSVWSVKIDCVNSKVILTKTSDENKTVSQSVFSVSEKRMTELFSFLRIDTIDAFEKIMSKVSFQLCLKCIATIFGVGMVQN